MWRLTSNPARASFLVLASICGAGCRNPERIAIGYASGDGGMLNAGTVAETILDSLRPSGTPRIRIVTGDSVKASMPGGALMGEVDKAIRFVGDPAIVAVVGPGGSREALQTAPIYREAGLPNVDPISTSRRLHDTGPWTFMLAADDSIQGEFIGAFVADRLRARSALLFYIPDEYGLGLATGTTAALKRRGIHLLDKVAIRSRELCPPKAALNPYDEAVAVSLHSVRPDVIVIAARSNEAACISQAVRARLPGARFVSGDGVLVEDRFLAMAGAAADSMYLVAFWHPTQPDSLSRAFVSRFTASVGRTPRHDDAMYYDAVMLVADAIEHVGPRRAAIRDYLEELGRTRPPYRGITGPIAFTPQAPRPLLMTRIRGGRTEPVPAP